MINKQLMLVAMLSVGTALTTMGKVKPAMASLTPPSTYDYSYTWNATDTEQYLNVTGVDSIPLYTRTADGVYYNYTSTFNVLDGLTVTMIFNRSNTTWQASGAFWKPDENKIGSDGTVGSLNNKAYIKIDNQTNKNYALYLDYSSTPSDRAWDIKYDTLSYYAYVVPNRLSLVRTFYVPSYTIGEIFSETTTNSIYFDAWYLEDLGISDSYQEGLDAETNGILTDYLGTDAQQIGWVLIGIAAILFVMKGGK